MLAYHNDPAIKQKFVDRVTAHRKADQVVQGIGWDGETHSGCCIGCMFDKYNHSLAPTEIGYPEPLARLADAIHEGLPKSVCLPDDKRQPAWIERFTEAAKPGADLSLVWPRFAVWILTDEQHGVRRFTKGFSDCEAAIDRVGALWQRVIAGAAVESLKADFSAADAAADAAYAAADAADAADAAYTAYTAADAADAAYAAKLKFWIASADKLESLIKAA